MEQQPAAPDHIHAIFNEMEEKTSDKQKPWHDAMLALEDLNSLLKGKRIQRDARTILGALETAMGKDNFNILLEWIGVTITEGNPALAEVNNLDKFERFLNEETSRFSNAHPIGSKWEEAA